MRALIIFLVLVTAGLIATFSCKKEDPFSFTFDREISLSMPSLPAVIDTTMSVTTPDFSMDIDQALSSNGTAGDLIESIGINSISMENVTNPDQGLSFLDNIDLKLLSSDGSIEKSLASKVFANKSIQTGPVNLDVASEPMSYDFLKNLLKMKATLKSKADSVAVPASTIKTLINFTVNANPLK
ncbi:MAG: hypothetical protein KKA07_10015 [Bacteroidetes bacterium]|nr:hypothetical protein [Bacteroidota bacterium]MBU1719396.1 hypothetical protein [Bacteroidota bacterium]